ncbi:hypothetical protein [Caballeronia sp. ATUFL_F1_KS4A]|uniref:gasdermin n=1 Tax=Caballeronia sp. ATUFL_F1_KS4A TaxID=2921768 RepID=UPI0020278F8B|nr:hypothetical protein [Caballeronia sp. ATUFL_F1_KS4A]
MAWLKLCNNDPLVKTLRDVFHANIIRIPEEKIQPLCVIAARNGKIAYRGQLTDLIAGDPVPELLELAMQTSDMADIAGKRSRQIDLQLGLEILDGFLRGFGVPAVANVGQQLSGASQVSFTFSQVQRHYCDPAKIGRLLSGKSLERSNPVVASLVGEDPWDCLLIDSVITSRDFTLHVDQTSKQDLHLDVPAIEQVLSKAKLGVQVTSSSGRSLTFQGPKPLAFAFTCERLVLTDQAKIMQMPPDTQERTFTKRPREVLIGKQPVMLELEE